MVNITCLHSESQQQEKYTITCSHDGHWQPNLTDTCNNDNSGTILIILTNIKSYISL